MYDLLLLHFCICFDAAENPDYRKHHNLIDLYYIIL